MPSTQPQTTPRELCTISLNAKPSDMRSTMLGPATVDWVHVADGRVR